MTPSREQFLATRPLILGSIHRTPVLTCKSIDGMVGASLFFKCENFQKTGAFKMRGAAHAVARISESDRQKGVATHSSGNFAQSVALAAQNLGIPAYIVMPNNAPAVKKAAVIGYGAEVIECPPTIRAREETLMQVVERTGATPLHPSNDIDVILGQGTAAEELLMDEPNLDAIFVPVGGGGLLAGTALAAHYLSPETKVYAGEPMGADDAYRSLKAGEILPMENPNTIADGLRTSLGSNNFPIIQKFVTEIFRVEEEEIIHAMHMVWERMKIIIEPSCSVPLAALFKNKEQFAGKRVGIILSGGNVDLKNLPF
ncbi:pyridoxal-phosphate dependent enzyme [bacterium]|nr:pyridoxal-phosphate dependent enzyme [bacterium]